MVKRCARCRACCKLKLNENRDGGAWKLAGHVSTFHPLISRSGQLPTDNDDAKICCILGYWYNHSGGRHLVSVTICNVSYQALLYSLCLSHHQYYSVKIDWSYNLLTYKALVNGNFCQTFILGVSKVCTAMCSI